MIWPIVGDSQNSKFCLDAACAGDAPTAQGFVNRKQSGGDKNPAEPVFAIHADHDAGDEAERPDDAARDATVALEIGAEKIPHCRNLTQSFCVASGVKLCGAAFFPLSASRNSKAKARPAEAGGKFDFENAPIIFS